MIENAIFFGLGFIFGGISVFDLIRRYRKSLGFKPNPFEPENIYLI